MDSVDNVMQKRLETVLKKAGYDNPKKIINTLQGSTWRVEDVKTKESVVVKMANRRLLSKGVVVVDKKMIISDENILKEAKILSYLCSDPECPSSIIKYVDCFQCSKHIYLVEQDGGDSLFNFVVKAHRLIAIDHFEIAEWHRFVKVIFRQIIEGIEYMHERGVCHFDLSLENMLINDVGVTRSKRTNKLTFVSDARVNIVDFGLAEMFDVQTSDYQTTKYCGKLNYQSPEVTDRRSAFNAKSNDVFCAGVCLFMLVFGSAPFSVSSPSDPAFAAIMDGDLEKLLVGWGRTEYVNDELLELFSSMFRYEADRIDLDGLKKCKWLNNE